MYSFFKKTVFLNVALTLFLTAGFMAAPAEADVFQIGTPGKFQEFKSLVQSYGVNSTTKVDAELTADITLENWVGAVGALSQNIPYNGTFDGKGYKITIINENLAASETLSLFQLVSTDSVIQNLEMDVKARAATENINVLLINPVAINNYGTIRNVTVNCAIRGYSGVSGVVGDNYGRIEYAKVSGWIESSGTGSAAGIARRNFPEAVISHCVNNATIKIKTGVAARYVAGIVGVLNGRLEYSANHGDVINASGMGTGGLVGLLNSSSVSGTLSGDIYNSYNAGSVFGANDYYYVGGLVGGYEDDAHQFKEDCGIVNSFNYGQVTLSSGNSAAIIGTAYTGDYGVSGVTVTGMGASRNVYYLNTSASKLFGPGAPAENQVGDKFISKTADDFKTTSQALYTLLVAGPGGDKDRDGNTVWNIGYGDFPTLEGLGGPELTLVSPFTTEEPPEPTYDRYKTADPMVIENEDDLLEFAEIVNDGGNYQDAILSADLSFLDREWTSIAPIVLGSGEEPPAYRGTFDGKGHTIELKKTDSIAHTALFYSIGTQGVVKDLVVSLDFNGTGSNIAGVAVKHSGRIERVKTYGRIFTRDGVAAGLVARTNNLTATLYECANYADITAGFKAGGLGAEFSGIMEYCANYGNVTQHFDALVATIGGLSYAVAVRGGNTYSNVYNVGTVSAPNRLFESNSEGVGGLWSFCGLYSQYAEPDYPGYFRSNATNVFSYGDVLLQGGKGAVLDGGKVADVDFVNVENFFYRESAGSRIVYAGGAEGDDGWGTEYVKSKITGLEDDAFTDGTLLNALNAHPSGQYEDGSPRWGQGEKFPELLAFNPGLPTEVIPPDTIAPELTPGSATRTSATEATVKFTSDEDGVYYYKAVASDAAAPDIDTGEAGTALTAGETTTIAVSDLESGAYDLYIAAKDAAGNVSEPIKITIPAYTSNGGGNTEDTSGGTGNTGGSGSGGGNTSDTSGGTTTGGSTTPVDSDTTAVTVPGGNVTAPSDTVINETTGVATLPSSGGITLADGATALIVPPDTTIDLDTGIITVTQSGGLTLADGATELIVPPDTTIDSSTGIITVTQGGAVTLPASDVSDGLGIEFVVPSGTTIDPVTGIISVAADADALTLPGTDGATGSDQDNIQVIVPDGTTIDPATGMVTAVDGGRTVLPGPNRKIEPESTRRSSRGVAAGDDLEFYVTPGTTVDPYTGSVTITNGGEITLPDGTTVTVPPGTTIDPFNGVRNEPDTANENTNNTGTTDLTDAGGSSGGCDAGTAGFALLAMAMIAASSARKKTR